MKYTNKDLLRWGIINLSVAFFVLIAPHIVGLTATLAIVLSVMAVTCAGVWAKRLLSFGLAILIAGMSPAQEDVPTEIMPPPAPDAITNAPFELLGQSPEETQTQAVTTCPWLAIFVVGTAALLGYAFYKICKGIRGLTNRVPRLDDDEPGSPPPPPPRTNAPPTNRPSAYLVNVEQNADGQIPGVNVWIAPEGVDAMYVVQFNLVTTTNLVDWETNEVVSYIFADGAMTRIGRGPTAQYIWTERKPDSPPGTVWLDLWPTNESMRFFRF